MIVPRMEAMRMVMRRDMDILNSSIVNHACISWQAHWQQLACAFHFPAVEPRQPLSHWDYVLREGHWMADDFMQVI